MLRPSGYFLAVFIAAVLSLVMGMRILQAAFQVDAATTLGQITLVRMQQALALACSLSMVSSVLFLRAVRQIRQGTKRYHEFPPRRSTLVRPTAIVRGRSAERIGNGLHVLGWIFLLVSIGLVAGTLTLIRM